jgi:hypothetical protein
MTLNEIFLALGGGPGALMICALLYDRFRLTKRNDDLTGLLMGRKDDDLRASVEREISTRNTLEKIAAAISGAVQ